MKPSAIVLLGCVLLGACALAQTALQQSALVAVLAGAVVAELGGGKIGVAWSDPAAPPPTARRNVHHASIAFAAGALTAALALGVAFVAGSVHRESHGRPLLVPLALGLLEAFFFAIQSEILLRGVVRVLCKRTEPRAFVPLAVLIALAAAAGRSGFEPAALAAAGAAALVLALLWDRMGGGLVPIAAHTGLRFVLVTLASGSGFGLVGRGRLAGASLDSGLAAALACLAFAGAVAIWSRRENKLDQPSHPQSQ